MAYIDVTKGADSLGQDGAPAFSTWTATDSVTGGIIGPVLLDLDTTQADAEAKFNATHDAANPPIDPGLVLRGKEVVLEGETAVPVVEADERGGVAVILISPDGTRWRTTVTNAGSLVTTEVT